MNWNDWFDCPECGSAVYCYLPLSGRSRYDKPIDCKHCGGGFIVRTTIKREVLKAVAVTNLVVADPQEG